MPALSGGVRPEQYWAESFTQMEQRFQPWVLKAMRMRRLVQTELRNISEVSPYTGVRKNDVEVMRAQMSQYCSGRMVRKPHFGARLCSRCEPTTSA